MQTAWNVSRNRTRRSGRSSPIPCARSERADAVSLRRRRVSRYRPPLSGNLLSGRGLRPVIYPPPNPSLGVKDSAGNIIEITFGWRAGRGSRKSLLNRYHFSDRVWITLPFPRFSIIVQDAIVPSGTLPLSRSHGLAVLASRSTGQTDPP